MKLLLNFLIICSFTSIVLAQDLPMTDTTNYSLLRGLIKDQEFFKNYDPTSALPYMQTAVCKMKMKKLDEAIEDFQTAMKLESDSHLIANMHAWIGGSYDRLGKFEESTASFTKAISIGKKYPFPSQYVNIPELDMNIDVSFQYYNRGIIYNRMKQYDQAEKDFETSITLDSNAVLPYFGLGLVYEYQKVYVKAAKYYKQALEKDPQHYRTYNNLSNVYNQLGKYELALKMANKSLELSPQYPNPLINIASINQNLGNNEEACKAIQKYADLVRKFLEEKALQKKISNYCIE